MQNKVWNMSTADFAFEAANQSMLFSVIASGRGWLVVEKPCNLSVHNEPGRDLCSLLTRQLMNDRPFFQKIDFDPEFGLHAAHRLDRDTSGILLVACRRKMMRILSQQFQDREVEKGYLALVHGNLGNCRGNLAQGIWDWPLAKTAGGRQNPKGRGPRVACRTTYRVIGTSDHYTMIQCSPMTGRKHQIRRHAKIAGHPVVGDRRYGSPRSLKFLSSRCGFERLGLHAWTLRFKPPGRSQAIEFRTGNIPSKIQKLWAEDRGG